MLCSPEPHKDMRIQQRSATMFAVYLCPTRNTLFLTIVKRTVQHINVSQHCRCQVCTSAVYSGWSGTNKKKEKKRHKEKDYTHTEKGNTHTHTHTHTQWGKGGHTHQEDTHTHAKKKGDTHTKKGGDTHTRQKREATNARKKFFF